MAHPTVTAVIPCFNHGRFVRQAVESCLRQVEADVRVVVVNDGSSDESSGAACDACAGERVRVIHQENRGLPAARNRGAAEAESEFLIFLDADDWIEPTFITRLAAAIRDDPGVPGHSEPSAVPGPGEISHAYCQERLVEKGNGIWRVPEWDPVLMLITNLHPVTTLVRCSCFEAVGGFDESMTGGYEDWDLWIKFVERGWRGVRVREPLFVWRRHSDDTMIMNVIHNHEVLFGRIMARHAEIYQRCAPELLLRMNTMMRRFDVNWLDESGEPIRLMALRRQRDFYEAMLGVKAQRAARRMLARLPSPLAWPARCIRELRRVLGMNQHAKSAPGRAGGTTARNPG
jgi:glycosyltransferase involved in cell wall biosynthesis